jgi:peroxiredoxin/outer membrane lipoprotein-sorting protein
MLGLLIAWFCAVSAPCLARGEDPTSAGTLLQKVADRFATIRTLQAELAVSGWTHTVTGTGQHWQRRDTVLLKRPGLVRFRVDVGPHAPKGGDVHTGGIAAILSDGKRVYNLYKDHHCDRSPADPETLHAIASWAPPTAAFFPSPDPSREIDLADNSYAGKQEVDGQKCDVIVSSDTTRPGVLQTERKYIRADGLIVQIDRVVVMKEGVVSHTWTLHNVRIDADIPDAAFAYAPPAVTEVADDGKKRNGQTDALSARMLAVGSVAPAFDLRSIHGDDVTLTGALQGKRCLLVNFWFVGCSVCKREFPQLQQLSVEFKDRGFSMVAIDIGDEAARIGKYLERGHFSLPVAMDRDDTYKRYGVSACPTSYLIDATGRVVWRMIGYDEKGLRAAVQKLVVP